MRMLKRLVALFLLLALLPLPTLFLYGTLRNQMMIYAESRAFLPQSEAEQPKVAR